MLNSLVPFSRLDRIMDEFFAPAFLGNGETALLPRADILEGERDYQIRLEMPGVRREDLEIQIEDDLLTVSGKQGAADPQERRVLRGELAGGASYSRTFRLGAEVEADQVSARLEDGILVLVLPKSAKALPRRIEVK